MLKENKVDELCNLGLDKQTHNVYEWSSCVTRNFLKRKLVKATKRVEFALLMTDLGY